MSLVRVYAVDDFGFEEEGTVLGGANEFVNHSRRENEARESCMTWLDMRRERQGRVYEDIVGMECDGGRSCRGLLRKGVHTLYSLPTLEPFTRPTDSSSRHGSHSLFQQPNRRPSNWFIVHGPSSPSIRRR